MSHPCHKKQIPSINRIEGQIRGIARMIEEENYCVDILNQIKAVRKSIASVEGKILKTHLHQCVKDSLNNSEDFDEKVEEIMKILRR